MAVERQCNFRSAIKSSEEPETLRNKNAITAFYLVDEENEAEVEQ